MTTNDLPAIALSNLTRTFRTAAAPLVAVDGVDLRIEPGEIVAFLGPNGAGKTTTIDMVLGFTEPTAGRAEVFGLPPRRAIEAGRVSAVLQTGGLLRDLTVAETARLVASTFERHLPVGDALTRAGIGGLARRRVGKCSGGEQQRLRFALALLPNPDLLILDEPTAGLDVAARHEFWGTMREAADDGQTILFATHYLEEAEAFAQRIVLIDRGRIIADGPTDEIRSRSQARHVSASVTDPRAAAARLASEPGVADVSVHGGRVVCTAGDSDAVARLLLTELDGRGLEVSAPSLESAFLALTSTHQE